MPRLLLPIAVLLLLSTPVQAEPTPLRVGDAVSVSWSGAWYAASVLALRDDACLVRYDGWSSDWDEWVGPSRVRRPDGSAVVWPPVKRKESPPAPAVVAPKPKPAAERATSSKKKYGLANQWTFQTLTFLNPDGSTTDASRDVGGSLTLLANGQFRQRLRIGDFTNETHGTWKAKGDRLTLSYEWNGPRTDVLTFALEGERLSLKNGSGRKGERTTWYGLQLSGSCDAKGNCAAVPVRP